MAMRMVLLTLAGASLAVVAVRPLASRGQPAATTTPPAPLEIAFSSPSDRAHEPWRSQISYDVEASYRGKSTRYGELPASAIVVEARYLADAAATTRSPGGVPAALVSISQSNCAGCHDFTANGAGPSYAAVAQRYRNQRASLPAIATHIREGSRGQWGASAMPPHPDLSPEQATAIADWIVSHADEPGVRYAIGSQGSIHMTPVGQPGPGAAILLSAFYAGPLDAGDTLRSGGPASQVLLLGSPGS